MKNFTYSLSESDVKAILCTLEVMPSYGFYETESENDLVKYLSISSGMKLIAHEQWNNREIAYVALAIDNAFKALRSENSADDEIVSTLRPYLFTINKLHPVFSPYLDFGF